MARIPAPAWADPVSAHPWSLSQETFDTDYQQWNTEPLMAPGDDYRGWLQEQFSAEPATVNWGEPPPTPIPTQIPHQEKS